MLVQITLIHTNSMITPSEYQLKKVIASLKEKHPAFSSKKLSLMIKDLHPNWTCNAKRVAALVIWIMYTCIFLINDNLFNLHMLVYEQMREEVIMDISTPVVSPTEETSIGNDVSTIEEVPLYEPRQKESDEEEVGGPQEVFLNSHLYIVFSYAHLYIPIIIISDCK
jgi:hypothetical protein